MAKADKNRYMTALATINYVEEALTFASDLEESKSLINLLKDTCGENLEADIKHMYNKIISHYEDSLAPSS
jgi:hypothetical protein